MLFLFLPVHHQTNELTNPINLFFSSSSPFFVFTFSFPSFFLSLSFFHCSIPISLAPSSPRFFLLTTLVFSLSPLALYLQFTRPFLHLSIVVLIISYIHVHTQPHFWLLLLSLFTYSCHSRISSCFALCFLPYFFILCITHTVSHSHSLSLSFSLALFLSFSPFFFFSLFPSFLLSLSLSLSLTLFLPLHSQLVLNQFALGTFSTTKLFFNHTTYEGRSRRIRQQQQQHQHQ